MMTEASNILTKGTKKYILQQSNLNLDVAKNRKDEKLQDINLFIPKSTKAMQETENFSPNERLEKPTKSNAKKLRSIRLDLSSLKRSFIDKSEKKMSSDESSEDEEKINKKPCSVVPNYVTNSDSGPCRKPRRNRQDLLILSSQNSPKLTKAQPLSIARRNARERNRVKQVNEGFATLRSRIPEYISEVYNEEKGRKSAKKLSKVETLRMAVDYIRHLEKLLNIKSTNKEWAEEIKNENRPWETAVEHSSPNESKYPFSFAGSLGTSYDQTFECQDSMYYEYDLDLMTRRDAQNAVKTSTKYEGVTFIKNDEESEDDFRYYEILNRIRKGNDEIVNVIEEVKCTENLESSDRNPDASMFLKREDVESQEPTKNNVLPSITETFNKGIPVFF